MFTLRAYRSFDIQAQGERNLKQSPNFPFCIDEEYVLLRKKGGHV
jgi:hypothetical protein